MPIDDNSWFDIWPDGLIGLNKRNLIVELSPVAHSILGWSREELYGEHPHHSLCASTCEHELEDCPLGFLDECKEIASTIWRHRNGHHVSIDFRLIAVGHGEATRVISFVDNSTRLHNQEEMEKFSEYVEMSPAPLAEFVLDGQLLFGNSALQELLLEYGFDERGAAAAIPKNIDKIGERLMRSEHKVDIAEVKLGDRVFVWHFHLLDHSEEPTLVGYAFDITAQKKAEKLAAEQSSQARKDFYAKMVHELRSPLNAIIGFSDLLAATLQSRISSTDLKRLRLIKQAGVQLNEQVTATLDVAKIESGKMSLDISEFAIHELCQEIFEQMQSLAEDKGLAFHLSALTEQRFFSDHTKVRQIIVNLVSNAIKYTKDGRVNLVASAKTDNVMGECVSILVSDTGIGIKEQQIPRLFRSFEQADEEHHRHVEGTGLGLTLVDNLVKLLGGKIRVKSTYGRGSAFEVLLPFLKNDSMSINS